MIINQRFPFDHCEFCPECILDVVEETSTLFSDSHIVARQITVRCKNELLCIRLEEQRNARDEH